MPDLKDALDLIDTGRWVSIVYVSYDEKRRSYGDIIRIKRCRLATSKSDKVCCISDSTAGSSHSQADPPRSTAGSKDPNHFEHFTRNMKLANGSGIRKFHPRLLIAINGQKLV